MSDLSRPAQDIFSLNSEELAKYLEEMELSLRKPVTSLKVRAIAT